jgi:CheY-like chemotaxis protein
MMRKRYGNKWQARILVVDDNKTIGQTLSAILQERGYEVATAFSGEEAVAKADGFLPDLLVSDIFMSGMDGIEAATRITAKLPDCRVLFLSGHATMSDVLNTAPERLVYSFASKPVHPLDLINAIAYMLPATNTLNGPLAMAMEQDAVERFSLARMRVMAGFILRNAATGAAAATQTTASSLRFDCRLPDTPGLEMRLQ